LELSKTLLLPLDITAIAAVEQEPNVLTWLIVHVLAAAVGLTVGAFVAGAGAWGMLLAAVVGEGAAVVACVPASVPGCAVAVGEALWAVAAGLLADVVFWL